MTRFTLVLLIFFGSLAHSSSHYDLILENGWIYDGGGKNPYKGEVAIRDGKIAAVARAGKLSLASAQRRIDVKGQAIAPGFIDLLGWSEYNLLVDGRAQSKIFQGVTTEITGEGGSVAPINDAILKEDAQWFTDMGVTVDWRGIAGYLTRLEQSGTAINLGTFVGAGQIRRMVLGSENRSPSSEELRTMKSLVKEAMKQGAFGVSSALIYTPDGYASTQELIELAKTAAEFGGIYATHIRNESDSVETALDEALEIGRKANIPVEIYHLKVTGPRKWHTMKNVLAKINAARKAGVKVAANQYPYVGSSTLVNQTIPPWAREGGLQKMLERLNDLNLRERLKHDILHPKQEWDTGFESSGGSLGIQISAVHNPQLKKYQGRRISEIAKELQIDDADAIIKILAEDGGTTEAIYFEMHEDDVRLAMREPWIAFGIDNGAMAIDGPLSKERPHPRAYGTFPRILGRYVRELKLFSLPQAIQRMTSLPAERVGLFNRGRLKPGYFADITVFDPSTIIDRATYENPNQLSEGINYVIVNGKLAIDGGQQTSVLSGRALTFQTPPHTISPN